LFFLPLSNWALDLTSTSNPAASLTIPSECYHPMTGLVDQANDHCVKFDSLNIRFYAIAICHKFAFYDAVEMKNGFGMLGLATRMLFIA